MPEHGLVWGHLPYVLLDGLCIGAIYALIALGYTMVYGIIKLINFAHGEFFMVGAYAGVGCYLLLPVGWPAGLVVALVLLGAGTGGAVVAMLTERIAYRPIRAGGRLIALLTAIGVSLLLQTTFAFFNNGNPLRYQRLTATGAQLNDRVQDWLAESVSLGDQQLPALKLGFLVITAVLMVLLWYLVMRTRFGRAMRAISQDLEAARLMGIHVDRVILLTFALGGFFAGVAGALVGAMKLVEPYMGFKAGLVAFVAAVVGGIGNIPGAVLGGLFIGVAEQVVAWLLPSAYSGYKDVATFVLLILVLVVRPQGLLGRVVREKV